MPAHLTDFWAGTERSLEIFLESGTPEKVAQAEKQAAMNGMQPREMPRLLSKQGNVGVLAIDGSLVTNSSWIDEYVGRTAYSDIREALIAAANDPEVKAIVLDINSGGGSTMGVSDTAELIALVDAKVKPVYAFSGSAMNSAAYWLGSSARSVTIGKMAEVGSIGVLLVHREASKMMEKDGITTTVMRAGRYKALANGYEPLTEEAKAEVQGQLDQLYGMFAQHVADSRGVPYTQADQKMGQGRVFMGQTAVDMGLADKVSSFDDLISQIQGGIDADKKSPKYGANSPKGPSSMKHALTDQAIAAMAACGLPVADGENIRVISAEAATPKDLPAVTSAEAVVPNSTPATETVAGDIEPGGTEMATATATAVDARVELLKEQLAAAQASAQSAATDLAMAKRDAQGFDAKLAAANATVEQMRPIVQGVVKNMQVALGGSATVLATSDEALLAEFSSVQANFAKKFKAGGVSASPAAAADNGGAKQPDDGFKRARIEATRPK